MGGDRSIKQVKQRQNNRKRPGVAKALLAWFHKTKRDLPWRRTSDPYAIWLSEVMLQQTTVQTVIPRWSRFLTRWPTLRDLAKAPLDDVLHEWTGLGYYARARNLHKAAGIVARDFDGKLPGRFELLLALPGMGPYTAAAVASIAFNEPVALVDANVERVLARLYAYPDDIKSTKAKRELKEFATELLDRNAPGDFNQALMELGSLVCLPGNPRCGDCPLGKICEGRASGDPGSFPVRTPKPALEPVREVALLMQQSDLVFLVRRPESGSFAGMWELPRVRCGEEEESLDAARRAGRELLGLNVEIGSPIRKIKHTVMRNKITLTVYKVRSWKGRTKLTFHVDAGWYPPEDWEHLPKSTTQGAICRFLLGRSAKEPIAVEEDDGQQTFL